MIDPPFLLKGDNAIFFAPHCCGFFLRDSMGSFHFEKATEEGNLKHLIYTEMVLISLREYGSMVSVF